MIPFVFDLDESLGLEMLFKIRGKRVPPRDVVIVAVDKYSSDHLTLPRDPTKWPRSLHARLTDILAEHGASVIAFNIHFDEPRSSLDDSRFAGAIARARNVILCGSIRSDSISLSQRQSNREGAVTIESLIPPIPQLSSSCLGLASFPLPKIPVRLSQSWKFKSGTGNLPTLPVVAFQLFSLDTYDDLVGLLAKCNPAAASQLPANKSILCSGKNIHNTVRTLRDRFDGDSDLGEKLLTELSKAPAFKIDGRKQQKLRTLIKMYAGAQSQYLDFYGPPGTITHIPYAKVLETKGKGLDLKGRIVFIGVSENLRPEQKDSFYTVFSESTGSDLSGVEIAATTFANLLEERTVEPVTAVYHLGIIFFWGLLIGILCFLLPTARAGIASAALCAAYFFAAYLAFAEKGTWIPLIAPLLIQVPTAFTGTAIWNYRAVHKERENIRAALRYYLPDRVVDKLSRSVADFLKENEILYGTILYTDAAGYTSLSEHLAPGDLMAFLNRYLDVITSPVRRHGGEVIDFAGDSMLAIWGADKPDVALRMKACRAALDIVEAVRQFGASNAGIELPIRIGLHAGYILRGNVGAIGHFEYGAVGDGINTACRLEGLNKFLHTSIIVSADVLEGMNNFLTRPLGQFVLAGKKNPLSVSELLCPKEEASDTMIGLARSFTQALDAFQKGAWAVARERFAMILEVHKNDGPAQYYSGLSREYLTTPPGKDWDDSIRMKTK